MLLNTHSYFSLRYGTIPEGELIDLALANGYSSIALTDINNTSAGLNFVRLAQKRGVKPLLGIDFRLGAQQHFVGIAQNNAGYLELNQYLSQHLHQKEPIPNQPPPFNNAFILYPFERLLELEKKHLLPHEFIGVSISDLKKIRYSHLFWQKEKIVVLQPVSFRNKRDHNIHRLLRAIDNNQLLSKLPPEEQAPLHEVMLHRDELLRHFQDFSFIIHNTERLIQQCSIDFDFSANRPHQNRKTYTGNPQSDWQMLQTACQQGIRYRYSQPTEAIHQRLEKELQLIRQMDYVPFFLINWDIVRYAKRKGYYHVGRGSGANSLAAYLLGITDVDPIALDLYFERFMNLYRANPPDFDIDFSWRDRDDVTRYIFEQFGTQNRAALLATYNTFGQSAALRELGKVFGLPKHEIDKLSSGKYTYTQLDSLSQLACRYAQRMQGMPNYLSIHAGGILISEQPIHYFSATDLPPKGFPTTQFDMVIAEDVGLFKYDILGQRGLGKIKEALEIVRVNQPQAPEVDIHDASQFIQDKKINTMISRAECIGCFYVESPAMRMLLKKLEVKDYLGLVAASSIIRPGVAKSGMMKEYILRHKNPERIQQAHPIMLQIMPETYGIMVYQEDVIKVAHHFAGLDLGEADVLRRGMSGKFRSREEFDKIKAKFFENCRQKGYPDALVNEVWHQTESFAGYAFAKGHSASYAVESYQSLYLKCYYPLEYMVACLNNGGGFYSPELYLHEARRCGGVVHAPHVNQSQYETSIKGRNIYLGFHMLHALEHRLATRIVRERSLNGAYTSLNDFVKRLQPSMEQLDSLIRIGAFRFTNTPKRNLLWQATAILQKGKPQGSYTLFDYPVRDYTLPELPTNQLENRFDEIELLGFPLGSPFDLLAAPPQSLLKAKELIHKLHENVEIYGYLITIKTTKTANGQRMQFGTFLDLGGDWIDTVHFPLVARAYPFRGKGVYRLQGRVVEEFSFYCLEVATMHKMAYVQDVRFSTEQSINEGG